MDNPHAGARADVGLGPARVDEDPRALAAKLVNAIYRLVKACQIHAENNAAVAQVVDFVIAATGEYAARANVPSAAILFTANAVFVNRQMLRASRETYQLALELGQMLEPCGVTEITVGTNTTAVEVAEFGRVVAELVRDGKPNARLTDGGWEGVKLRKVLGFTGSTNLSPPVKAARTYAAALMIVRGFYAELRQGKYELRQGIKRVAQKLVSQNDAGGRLLLSIAAAPPADADRAGLALSSAIVALSMASQLTEDRTLLSALASAALLVDVGRPRLTGYEDPNERRPLRRLNADEEELVPVSSLVALSALGKFHPPNLTRSVVVHEALVLQQGGLPHSGRRQPSLMSRILSTARAFAELRVPKGTTPALSIDDALQVLEAQARDTTDRTLLKLLVGALGIFPAGTMVELSTGEMGVVLATPALPVDFARPPVRILYDADAQLLEQPLDVDLAVAPQPGEPTRYVKRPIDTTDQQMKQMRAYVVQLAANRARKNSVAKMRAVMAKGEAAVSNPGSSSSGASSAGSTGSSPSISFGSGAVSPSWERSSGSGHSSPSGSFGGASRPSAEISSGHSLSHSSGHSHQGDAISTSRNAPTARPPTKRFDGRAVLEELPKPAPSPRGVAVPAPDGSKPGATSTRALRWDEYGKEIASAVGRSAEAEMNDTDALLAAYLSEEGGLEGDAAPGSQPPASRPASAHGSSPSGHSSQGGQQDANDARSFGLRWGGDRTSSQGHSVSSFQTGRGTTSERPVLDRGTTPVERPSATDFGGPGRATTGTAGLRLSSSHGRDPRSAQGYEPSPASVPPAAGYSSPPRGATKHGVGSEHPPVMPVESPDPDGFSFEERPFDPAPSRGARQPLRGSMSGTAAAPPHSGRRPSIPATPAVEPERPQPVAVPAPPVEPRPVEPAPVSLPVSRRGKAGSMNWGAPRRDEKK